MTQLTMFSPMANKEQFRLRQVDSHEYLQVLLFKNLAIVNNTGRKQYVCINRQTGIKLPFGLVPTIHGKTHEPT